MNTKPQLTFILGNSGSGKSTLAKRLADEQGSLHIDLDRFAWTRELGVRRPLPEAVAAIRGEIGDRPAVIEGCYADLIAALATDTDQLFFLDLAVEHCVGHCKRRPFEPHKWPSAQAQNDFLPRLLEHVRSYPNRTDTLGWRAHVALYKAFKGKKKRLVAPTDDPYDDF